MKSSAKNIRLSSLDDLFSTEETRQEAQADAEREKVRMIPLDELHPFAHHPFKVKDDEAMQDTVESVKAYGVLVPAIARPREEGGYELVAGHRRMTMRQPSSWWIPTCKGKRCCLASGRLRIG